MSDCDRGDSQNVLCLLREATAKLNQFENLFLTKLEHLSNALNQSLMDKFALEWDNLLDVKLLLSKCESSIALSISENHANNELQISSTELRPMLVSAEVLHQDSFESNDSLVYSCSQVSHWSSPVIQSSMSTVRPTSIGRSSSVSHKVNGSPVVISEEAYKRSEVFMYNSPPQDMPTSQSASQSSLSLRKNDSHVMSQPLMMSEELQRRKDSYTDSGTHDSKRTGDIDALTASSSSSSTAVPSQPLIVPTGGRVSSLFQKVNGRPVIISEEAYKRSESIFSLSAVPTGTVISSSSQQSNSSVSSVFQKVNGSPVVISDEARRRSESFMISGEQASVSTRPDSAEAVPIVPALNAASSQVTGPTVVVGGGRVSSVFQKVNGRPVVISEQAQRKSASFMSSSSSCTDSEMDIDSAALVAAPVPTSQSIPTVPVQGERGGGGGGRVSSVFQKVNGKPVVISEKAVKKSETFLNNAVTIENTPVGSTTQSAALPVSQSGSRVSSLFQKVNGKPVLISEEAARKSVAFLSSAVPADCVHSTPTPSVPLSQQAIVTPSSGLGAGRVSSVFQKVGGKPVIISEEAVKKSESFLSKGMNVDSVVVSTAQTSTVPLTQSTVTPASSSNVNGSRVSSVFQKVNGRPVMISEEAMKKSESFLSYSAPTDSAAFTSSAPITVMHVSQTSATPLSVMGQGRVSSVFQKVNGNPVMISEEAVKKSASFLSSGSGTSNDLVVDSIPLVTPAKDPSSSVTNIVAGPALFQVPYGAPSTSFSAASKPSSNSSAVVVTPATPSLDLSSVQDPALARDLEWFFSLVEPPAVMTPDAVVINTALKPSPRDHMQRVVQLWQISSAVVPLSLVFDGDGVAFELVKNHSLNTNSLVMPNAKLKSLLESFGPLFKDLYERIQPENVDESLLHWLNMQLRWITWTMASYERRFPEVYAYDLMTFKSLLQCLQWRYDVYCSKSTVLSEPVTSPTTKSVVTPYTRRTATHQQLSSSIASRSAGKYPSAIASPVARSAQKPNRVRGHVEAKTHFSKRGSMSPLQRSCDIACFIWPMVLCFSTSGGQQSSVYEVCDGWWWSEVKLDRELQQLVDKGLLRDGVKIAVFGAAFVASQSDDDSSSCVNHKSSGSHTLHLNYNSVRLAKPSAKLGQLPPESLLRGISMASTTEAGGPIFCIRGRILDISCVMSKIKRSIDPADNTASNRGVELNTVLNQGESTELKKMLEKMKQKTIDSLDNMPELTMASLLDSYGCDDDVIEDFKKLENGEDSFISAERMRELSSIKAGLEMHRHKVAMSLMNAKMMKYHMNEARFVDILMVCEVSKLQFWMRMMYRGDSDDDSSGGGSSSSNRADVKFSLGSQFTIGNEIAVANVKRIHSITSLPLVMCSSSSRVKVLRESETVKAATNGVEIVQKIDTAMGVRVIGSLRDVVIAASLSSDNTENKFKGKFAAGKQEVSFVCTIVDWLEQNHTACDGQSSGSVDDGLISITIFAIDASRTCVEIRYTYPVELVGKISWLAKKNVIYVQYGIIHQVDEKYDVIQVGKGDHTNIQSVSVLLERKYNITSNSSGVSYASPTRKTPNKRKFDDLTAVISKSGTPGQDSSAMVKELEQYSVPVEVYENEHRRYQALRNNANQFQAYHPAGRKQSTRRMIIEKCHRIHWNGVKVIELEERNGSAAGGGDDDSQNTQNASSDSCSNSSGGGGIGGGLRVTEFNLSFETTDGTVMKAVVDGTMVDVARGLVEQLAQTMDGNIMMANLVAVDCFSVTENRSLSQSSATGGGEGAKTYLFSNEYKRIVWMGRL